MQGYLTPQISWREQVIAAAMRVASVWKRICWSLACVITILFPNAASAALSARDLDTQTLERKAGNDPRAAIGEGESAQQQGSKSGNKAQLLGALRLMVMANAQLEDNVALEKSANEGLALARELRDPQAESEFLAGKAVVLSSAGKHIEAQRLFDEAISVAEKSGLTRAATSAMVSKAFVFGLLGRDTDSLDLLFKAHQRFVDLGDAQNAARTMSHIGTAYARESASRDDLAKALTYHLQSITPGAEKHSRHELADVYFNIGVVYQRLKDLANAKSYILKSIALFRALNDPVGLAFGNYRLGVLAGESGKWGEALTHLDNALPALAKSGDATMVFNAQRARAKALAHLDRRRESLDALAGADAERKRIESSWIETAYLTSAAEVYAKLGDFEKAYRAQMRLVEAERRSILEAREKDAAEVQAKFEVKQKEVENTVLRARERESDARSLAMALALVLLLFVLGGLAWFLYRQSQQNRRFANLAMRDDLTGLPNRRSILEFARAQLRTSRVDNVKMCLALIDIDHFKTINDECGHAVGDAVLSAFAEMCSQQMRSNDKLGRYGGEEFLLIMPGSHLTQIPQVFNRLRDAIQLMQVPGLLPGKSLTFSMGAVEVTGPADDLDKLIKRADDALYRAKQGGRDRFELGQ